MNDAVHMMVIAQALNGQRGYETSPGIFLGTLIVFVLLVAIIIWWKGR